jgi:hypothetical protein
LTEWLEDITVHVEQENDELKDLKNESLSNDKLYGAIINHACELSPVLDMILGRAYCNKPYVTLLETDNMTIQCRSSERERLQSGSHDEQG